MTIHKKKVGVASFLFGVSCHTIGKQQSQNPSSEQSRKIASVSAPCNGAVGRFHPNGGGFVADTARVESIVPVGPQAQVCDQARVYTTLSNWGHTLRPAISNNAKISGRADVFSNAKVSGNAKVSSNARVFGNAKVYDNARVSGNTRVFDNDSVSQDAHFP